MELSLENKVVLITGASRGIGQAITMGLAQAGADIAIASRKLPDLEKVAVEIKKMGRKCLTVAAHIGKIEEINNLNKVPYMCGIIIQLPLPASLDQRRILDSIDSKIDVDCLGSVASLKFYNGDFTITFPTALACLYMLDSLNLDLKGKNIIIIGKGELVGRPVKKLLNARNLETFVIDRKTEEAERTKRLKEADVIISATGKGKLINGHMIKEGAILIDAGTSESGAGIVGDIDLDSVSEVAGYVSPVPGGVGPVTVAMLLQNVLTVAKNK